MAVLVLAVLLTSALGLAASAQVATLGSPAPEASPDPSVVPVDGQEALLTWAACMREQGVPMDDPRFDAEGNLVGGLGKDGAGSETDTKSETYTVAEQACADLLTSFKAPPDAAQQAEQAERLLAWAACMREQGVDMPDPNADGSFGDYEWKIDLEGAVYLAADEACRHELGEAAK